MTPDDPGAFASAVLGLLDKPRPEIELPERFLLRAQTEATLAIYQKLMAARQDLTP